jgi:hypothetical protein
MNTLQSLLTQSLEEAASAGKGAGSVVVPLLLTEISKKVNKLGGEFTNSPLTPTPVPDDTTLKAANTAFVIGQASVEFPTQIKSKTPVVGTSKRFSREDHTHDIDHAVVQLKEDKNAVNGYPSLDEVKMLLNSQHKPSLKAGTGVQYNGTNSYHSVPDNDLVDFANGVFTLEWFGYINKSTSYDYLMHKYVSGVGYQLFKEGGAVNNYIALSRSGDGDAVMQLVETNVSLPGSGWYHIVAVANGLLDTDVTIYINGRNQSLYRNGNACVGSLANAQNLLLGRDGASGSQYATYQNSISRTYNYALSASEVATLWNGGKPNQYKLPQSFIGANNTELVTGGDMSGVNPFTNAGNHTSSIVGGELEVVASGAGVAGTNNIAAVPYDVKGGKLYKLKFRAKGLVGGEVLNFKSDFVYIARAGFTNFSTPNTLTNSWVNYEVYGYSARTTNSFLRFYLSAAGTCYIDDVSFTQVGATLSLEAQNAYSDAWIDNSNLQIATPFNNPIVKLADDYAAELVVADYNVTASIAAGKTFKLPAGYYIDQIQVGAKSGALSALSAESNGITLFSGKSIASEKIMMFKEFSGDQIIETADVLNGITITATEAGGTFNTSIVIFLKRKA